MLNNDAPITSLGDLLDGLKAISGESPRLIKVRGARPMYIRELSIGELQAQINDTEGKKDLRGLARGACRLLCDEHGVQLMDPNNESHVTEMMKVKIRLLTAINKAGEAEEDPAGN